MPRIRVEDYDDFDDDQEPNIESDDPKDRLGRKIPAPKPTKQDRDWEEQRRSQQRRRNRNLD
jgi:hypothetical protein